MATNRKLRRLAARAEKVFDRHKGIASVGAFSSSLVPRAQAFKSSYDAITRFDSEYRRETLEGRNSLAGLLNQVNQWKPHVARENPSVNLSDIGDRPTVPEDLIEDAERLRDHVAAVKTSAGTAPDWAAGAISALDAAIAAADKESGEAASANAQYTDLQRRVSETAIDFDGELQRFRRTLSAAIGRTHPDFQKLRSERASDNDADDDADPSPAPAA